MYSVYGFSPAKAGDDRQLEEFVDRRLAEIEGLRSLIQPIDTELISLMVGEKQLKMPKNGIRNQRQPLHDRS
jgi:hypothetical protein